MSHLSRRQMLAQSTLLAAGVHLGLATSAQSAANEKLNIACVGVGGKGWSDMHETSVGQNIVAICDIDEGRLAKAGEAFPQARKYTDWRKLLEQNDIDAVTVSTPDHMHAPVAMSAIDLGRHVYCQKPLCHSIHEVRQMTLGAARKNVVTQMGIQHHSAARFKTAVKLLRQGTIGKVREAHSWTDRPGTFWSQATERPTGSDPVPKGIHWDRWLGVAPERPYKAETYHPFRWRGFWDFGTGALGDMGCHGMDPVVNAMKLGAPTTVRAESSQLFDDTAPAWSVIHYDFPGTEFTTTKFRMSWYDGGQRPDASLFAGDADAPGWANGILFLGEKGQLVVDYEKMPRLLPADHFADVAIVPEPEDNHYQQWVSACKGHGQTSTPFSYSGPMTETVLLGNVAIRSGQTIEWDADNLVARGVPEAASLIRRAYRDGWKIKGLS